MFLKLKELETFSYLVTDLRWRTHMPTFQDILSSTSIEKYSKDYDYKWTEVMYTYMNNDAHNFELLLLYDFEKNDWYVEDFTYNSPQEYKISSLKDYLLLLFNPKRDLFLASKIAFFSKKDTSGYFKSIIPEYLKWHEDMINKYIKD